MIGQQCRSRTKGYQIAKGIHFLAQLTAHPKKSGSPAIQTVCHQSDQNEYGSHKQVVVERGNNRTHAPACEVHTSRKSGIAELGQQTEGCGLGLITQCHHEYIQAVLGFRQQRLLFQRQQNPLQSHSKTDSRCGIAADFLDEPIVAAAASDCALCSQGRVLHLEGGLRVVVQAADQPWIQLEGHAGTGQQLLDLREMLPAFIAEAVRDLRRSHRQLFAAFHLAVQNAHGRVY